MEYLPFIAAGAGLLLGFIIGRASKTPAKKLTSLQERIIQALDLDESTFTRTCEKVYQDQAIVRQAQEILKNEQNFKNL